MSIKTKILLSMVIVGLLVAVPASALFYSFTERLMYQNAVRSRMNDAKRMSVMVADNLEMNDYVPIQNYLHKMKAQDPSLLDIAVADPDGKIVSGTDPSSLGQRFVSGDPENGAFLQWKMEVRSSVKENNLGTISVRYDREVIAADNSRELKMITGRIGFIAFVALCVGIIPGLFLAYGITRPLRRLTAACHKVSAGNLEIDLQPQGSDEVYVVTREVKSMVGKLKELDQLKDDFVNNVSHELRSPLASIKSYSEILQSGSFGPLTAKQLEFIEIIKKATVRLSTFVNNMLDVAKIKAGKFELDYQTANLYDILSDTVAVYQPLFIEKGVTCEIEGRKEGSQLECDAESIKRVVINLVSNALKFTPAQGSIRMTVKGEAGALRFEVHDTGPGISAEDLPKLFRRFEQTTDVHTKVMRKKGTGLGLSISRDIIEMHGGKIWAESDGGGSVFIFTVPAVRKTSS